MAEAAAVAAFELVLEAPSAAADCSHRIVARNHRHTVLAVPRPLDYILGHIDHTPAAAHHIVDTHRSLAADCNIAGTVTDRIRHIVGTAGLVEMTARLAGSCSRQVGSRYLELC